ncbi:toxin-antitoxin system YwqK family antitoxin [Marivirga harenae]|uniref:toxin-antitoxin system YwqK family antitoxin n=1 Tax=Marivirga harenae TaxID=2010992 RepID=UPI0026DF4D48|nr:toxin-antitoxin system YwqK family antitoxin [Marivirga harenae]WKV10832.1 membrane-binding protein [Marivirga harenae]|tara:strand:- start:107159 stop:108994 length:1836 start_codon:yes stop_codon:yes gene_type:complete
MKIVFSIILTLVPYLLSAQSKEVKVYYDDEREHLKERYFVKDLDPSILYGTYESYYISGELKSKGQYINDETYGQWKYYYENGKLKMQGQLKNNSNHGLWSYYFENGELRMEGRIYDGQRQSLWKYYYETGIIKSEGEYKDDQKNGLWTNYSENGNLKAKAIYKNGNGIYKEFYPSGNLKSEGFIKDEQSDSLWKNYYKTGNLKSKGNYKEGAKEGRWVYFYEDGKLSGEGSYVDNLSHGKWVYYHSNGQVSAEGAEREGKKEGYWKLYFEDGRLKGEGIYDAGSGEYKEFYESGKLKLKGSVVDGKSEGKWEYFYESGEKEGKAEFENGKGEFIGYYLNGDIKMKGLIEDGVKIGTWELYDDNGKLAGYYKPIYEDYEPLLRTAKSPNELSDENPQYNKPDYRYKSKSTSYFKSRNNDFPTLILQANPFNMLFGDLQVALEYNIQQRIGYELLYHTFRNPFFANSLNLRAGDNFFQGFGFSFRQRFYHKDTKFGMPYFGHSISYTNVDRFKYYEDDSGTDVLSAEMNSQGIRYGLLVGSRILQNLNDNGFTFDINLGINFNYYFFGEVINEGEKVGIFEDIKSSSFKLQPIVGLSFGYVFKLKNVKTLNP